MSIREAIQNFMKKHQKGPFRHRRLRNRILGEVFALIGFLGSGALIAFWVKTSKELRDKRNNCPASTSWVPYLVVIVVASVVNLGLFIASSRRFRPVLLPKDGGLGNRDLRIDSCETGTSIVHRRGMLKDTSRKLEALITSVKEGSEDLFAATEFLASDNGFEFLKEVVDGVKNLRMLEGQVVRRDTTWATSFTGANILCFGVSLAGAYTEADDCTVGTLVLQFLQYLSVTLLTIIAVAAFAGIQDYAQLTCTPVEKIKLTKDEKFLLSLLAANSLGGFRGFAKTSTSCYANIVEEGVVDAFQPVHMSLFAYREARTADSGKIRHYDEFAKDCVGNYEMAGRV